MSILDRTSQIEQLLQNKDDLSGQVHKAKERETKLQKYIKENDQLMAKNKSLEAELDDLETDLDEMVSCTSDCLFPAY